MFFSEKENTRVIDAFLRKAEVALITDESRKIRLNLSREIIKSIYKSPSDWDERCSFNIKHIGAQYLECLRDFNASQLTTVDFIYVFSYRFLCEFDFLVGAGKELGHELRKIRTKIQEDNAELDADLRTQMVYASFYMPANIAKEFINDANIGIFRDFEQKKQEAEMLKEQWENEIQLKKIETDNLKDKLDEYKIAFNFVGLYQGFADLLTKKSGESLWLFWSLIGMGLLILAPLIVEIIFESNNILSLDINRLIVLLPLISLEIILIYFFRVILLNHRSVKAQTMQIELRQTLCQFIQSYAEYSAKIKKQDGVALEKFESLIFSGILSDPEKLPSTFDGIEQISNFIKSIKKT